MCEFCDVFKNSIHEYQQWMSGINIPDNNFTKILLTQVRPSVCPITNRHLSHEEMFPSHANCSRCLSHEAYESIFASRINEQCMVCGSHLPNGKLRAQRQNGSREVRNHIHEECVPLWALMHSFIVGNPPQAAQVVQNLRHIFLPQSTERLSPFNRIEHRNIIDAEMIPVRQHILNSHPQRRMLSEPVNNNIFSTDRLTGNTTKNDENLVFIKLPKR